LVQIRYNETLPGTVLAATFGIGQGSALRADRDARADQGAVGLTRYPPALAAALEKIETKGSTVEGQPSYMAHLWLADPRGAGGGGRGRLPLRERIEALREL
jgi:Zn-dependent protease with chaperone function